MAVSRFQKSFQRQSVFNCRICKRGTRDTGDNGSVELCPQCNQAAMVENGMNDGNYGEEDSPAYQQADTEYNRLCQAAVNLGGTIKGFVKQPS